MLIEQEHATGRGADVSLNVSHRRDQRFDLMWLHGRLNLGLDLHFFLKSLQ